MSLTKKVHENGIITFSNRIHLAMGRMSTLFPLQELAYYLKQQTYEVTENLRTPFLPTTLTKDTLLAFRKQPFTYLAARRTNDLAEAAIMTIAHTATTATEALQTIYDDCNCNLDEFTLKPDLAEKVARTTIETALTRIRDKARDIPLNRRIEIFHYASFIMSKYGLGHLRKVLEHYPDAAR